MLLNFTKAYRGGSEMYGNCSANVKYYSLCFRLQIPSIKWKLFMSISYVLTSEDMIEWMRMDEDIPL